jgi:hypothetical protein
MSEIKLIWLPPLVDEDGQNIRLNGELVREEVVLFEGSLDALEEQEHKHRETKKREK